MAETWRRLGLSLAIAGLCVACGEGRKITGTAPALPPAAAVAQGAPIPGPGAAKSASGEAAPAAGEQGEGEDPVVGALDEGKIYRRVDDHPITGREVAEQLVEEHWKEELRAFRDHVLVREALARTGLAVSDAEIDAELKSKAEVYARREGLDPQAFSLPQMARRLSCSLRYLRETMYDTLGLKKILVKDGAIQETERLEDPKVSVAMQKRLESLARASEVVSDPEKLGSGEVLRVSGRGFSKAELRAFILDRIGALSRKDLLRSLEPLTLTFLVERALKALGKAELADEDRLFHLSYCARSLEVEKGVPNGGQAMKSMIQELGLTPEQFMRRPAFTIDAGITALARARITAQEIRAEYQAHTENYRRKELKLSHLLLRVRDPQGTPYAPDWKAAGHTRVNEYAEQVRETRFQDARRKMEEWIGAAKSDFAKAADELSEDETNREKKGAAWVGKGGYLGRVGAQTELPGLPIDADAIRAALKLKPGEISAPLRSAYGWHLVKCLERQETSYEEAEQDVYLELLKRRFEQLDKDLLKNARTEDNF